MTHAVVIGGGLGGLASAARLAKLGHRVTLLEAAEGLGGVIGPITKAGHTWSAGPPATLLPAVLRDLFRKTGRPLESELELVPVDPIRQHRFPDRSRVDVPSGRAAQLAAFDELGPGLGSAWCSYVGGLGDTWDLLRRDFLERPYDPALADPRVRGVLTARESLAAATRRGLPDPRLRAVAAFPTLQQGHDLERVPAWIGVDAYVAQRFGLWTVPGGFHRLAEALAARLSTRGVSVRTGVRVHDLVVINGRLRALRTSDGDIDCEIAVCAIDPRTLPALRGHVRGTTPTTSGSVVHLGLDGPPGLPAGETVFHGDPADRDWVCVQADDDALTVTVSARGSGDPVERLARLGCDLRSKIEVRVDAAPSAAYGVQWRGRATLARRLGPTTPIPGVYAAGAHANPGAGVPYVGLSAALVAQAIGPATGEG